MTKLKEDLDNAKLDEWIERCEQNVKVATRGKESCRKLADTEWHRRCIAGFERSIEVWNYRLIVLKELKRVSENHSES